MQDESNVEFFDCKMPFKFCSPRVREIVPDGVEFFSGAVLTLWVPTLSYCAITHQILPLYYMLCIQAIGTSIGVLLFEKQPSSTPDCCVPKDNIPAASVNAAKHETKKAA